MADIGLIWQKNRIAIVLADLKPKISNHPITFKWDGMDWMGFYGRPVAINWQSAHRAISAMSHPLECLAISTVDHRLDSSSTGEWN